MDFNFILPAIALATLAAAGCGGHDPATLGREYVDARQCATCHQSSAASDGVLSGQATPRPGTLAYGGNLTPDVDTGLGAWADIEVVRAIRDGVDHTQTPLCPTMPRFAVEHYPTPSSPAPMTDAEAYAITAYLRTLPAVSRTDIPASQCPPLKPGGTP